MSRHQHYYVDRSGGFGWPSCVICGAAPDDAKTVRRGDDTTRRCCGTSPAAPHGPVCQSLDARQRRGQTGLGPQ